MGRYQSDMDGWGLGPAAQLLLALIADAIGMIGIIPAVGWIAGGLWGPVQAFLVYSMLSNDPAVWRYTVLALVEEELSFTEVVELLPSVTIAWLHKYTGWI